MLCTDNAFLIKSIIGITNTSDNVRDWSNVLRQYCDFSAPAQNISAFKAFYEKHLNSIDREEEDWINMEKTLEFNRHQLNNQY